MNGFYFNLKRSSFNTYVWPRDIIWVLIFMEMYWFKNGWLKNFVFFEIIKLLLVRKFKQLEEK